MAAVKDANPMAEIAAKWAAEAEVAGDIVLAATYAEMAADYAAESTVATETADAGPVQQEVDNVDDATQDVGNLDDNKMTETGDETVAADDTADQADDQGGEADDAADDEAADDEAAESADEAGNTAAEDDFLAGGTWVPEEELDAATATATATATAAEAATRPKLANTELVADGVDKHGKPKYVARAHTPGLIADRLDTITREVHGDAWPKQVGGVLFTRGPDDEPVYRKSHEQLFAWLKAFADVTWGSAAGAMSQKEFFEFLRQDRAESYAAIERLPHHPPMPRAYYMHPPVEPRAGRATLDAFLDFFCFATPEDRTLALAAFVTLFWGEGLGARPSFLITTDEDDVATKGVGVGKSSFIDRLAAVAGGYVALRQRDSLTDFVKRLLTSDGERVIRIDNIKSFKLSWDELEDLITSPVISGHRMHVGEGKRPNTYTALLTMNGGSLGQDLADRVMVIQMSRPKSKSGGWERELDRFIADNRWRMIGEIIGLLAAEPAAAGPRVSRNATWDADVLSKVAGADEMSRIAALTAARRLELNSADAEADDFEEFVAERLKRCGHDLDRQTVRIPINRMGTWYCEYSNERVVPHIASRKINRMPLRRLQRGRADSGRFWVWLGTLPEPVDLMPELTSILDLYARNMRGGSGR